MVLVSSVQLLKCILLCAFLDGLLAEGLSCRVAGSELLSALNTALTLLCDNRHWDALTEQSSAFLIPQCADVQSQRIHDSNSVPTLEAIHGLNYNSQNQSFFSEVGALMHAFCYLAYSFLVSEETFAQERW